MEDKKRNSLKRNREKVKENDSIEMHIVSLQRVKIIK